MAPTAAGRRSASVPLSRAGRGGGPVLERSARSTRRSNLRAPPWVRTLAGAMRSHCRDAAAQCAHAATRDMWWWPPLWRCEGARSWRRTRRAAGACGCAPARRRGEQESLQSSRNLRVGATYGVGARRGLAAGRRRSPLALDVGRRRRHRRRRPRRAVERGRAASVPPARLAGRVPQLRATEGVGEQERAARHEMSLVHNSAACRRGCRRAARVPPILEF